MNFKFRKLGKRVSQSSPSSDNFQRGGTGEDVEDDSFDDKDDKRPNKVRWSSESAISGPPPYSTSNSTPGPRHASISEGFPVRNQLHLQEHSGIVEIPHLLDSLGLNLVHTCSDPTVDIIFVHGLGGTPRGTWSWQRDPKNFWPAWLSQEADLCKSRIFTFGYNAHVSGQGSVLNLLDFAKDLLLRMKTYSNGGGVNDQPIGKVSIQP